MPLLLQFIGCWSKIRPLCCYAVLGAGECPQQFASASHLVVLSREHKSGVVTSPAHAVMFHTLFTPMADRNTGGHLCICNVSLHIFALHIPSLLPLPASSLITFLQPAYSHSRFDKLAKIPVLREIIDNGKSQVTYRTRDLTAKNGRVRVVFLAWQAGMSGHRGLGRNQTWGCRRAADQAQTGCGWERGDPRLISTRADIPLHPFLPVPQGSERLPVPEAEGTSCPLSCGHWEASGHSLGDKGKLSGSLLMDAAGYHLAPLPSPPGLHLHRG